MPWSTTLLTTAYLHLLLGRTLQRQGRHDDARGHLALAEVLGDHPRPVAYGEPTTSDQTAARSS